MKLNYKDDSKDVVHMCEFVSKRLELAGEFQSPNEIYNDMLNGELFPLFELYALAKASLSSDELEDLKDIEMRLEDGE